MIHHADAYLIDGTIKSVILSDDAMRVALVQLRENGVVELDNKKHGTVTAVGILVKGREFEGRGF